ncbi:MAG: substrate-binding domain-containing protein [Spirochaetia bacterium]|jgi:hypothetical protein|nr:substrate-binding domain-containing protein [Spirochaetia bacterium]
MKGRIAGLAILVLVIAAAFVYQSLLGPGFQETAINGYLGGEKSGLFEDERFARAMAKKHGISVHYKKAGSIDMVSAPLEGMDYLFPSSYTALELYKQKYGPAYKRAEVVFNSPIVLYARKTVAQAFKQQGWAHTEGETDYIDLRKLIDAVLADTRWSAIGLDELYGNIFVISTDPLKSNSGNMFAGLVANMLGGGEVADGESLEKNGRELKRFFRKLGYLESSSADLFNSFLKTGIGAKPVIVGYESQILEFSARHPEDWKYVKDDIAVLYPEPTVWSAHPFIALSENGERVMDALLGEEIQALAWETHGFRTGIASGQAADKAFDIQGVPGQVKKVIQLPNPDAMRKIMDIIAH